MNESPERPSLLMITVLDYDKFWNNLEHHRVREYRRQGVDLKVVYRSLSTSPGVLHMIRDTLRFRCLQRVEEGVTLVGVDSFFNYFAGVRRQAEAADSSPTDRGPSWRTRLIRGLSFLSVLRDVFLVPGLLYAAWRHRGEARVCLGFGPWGTLIGWCLAKLGRIDRVIYYDRDYEPDLVADRFRRWYTARLETFLLPRADRVFSIGERLAARRQPLRQDSVMVMPSGVDWQAFAVARERAPSGSTLLYVGYLSSWCGLELVIQALPRVRETCPEVRLRVAGEGVPAYEARLRTLCEEHRVADLVEFLGQRPPAELPELWRDADVGLANSEPVPFRQYACPLKVLEGLAAGRPVLATEGTEAADLIRRGDCGLAAPYEIEPLERALLELLQSEEKRRHWGTQGAEFAREYDWKALLARERELIL